MFSIFKLKNSRGVYLDLTRQDKYVVTNVTGLNPVQAELVQNTSVYYDGVRIGNQRLSPRNIVIMLTFRQPVGKNRAELYDFVQTGDEIEVRIQKEREEVSTRGIVETLEADIFEQKCSAMISILCPDPYFYSLSSDTYQTGGTKLNSITFPINLPVQFNENGKSEEDYLMQIDAGTSGCGFEAIITFHGPASHFTIQNNSTQEHLSLDVTSFQANDVLTINTKSGNLKASYVRSGTTTNILNEVSDFIQLRAGVNEIKFALTGGDAHVNAYKIKVQKRYGALV